MFFPYTCITGWSICNFADSMRCMDELSSKWGPPLPALLGLTLADSVMKLMKKKPHRRILFRPWLEVHNRQLQLKVFIDSPYFVLEESFDQHGCTYIKCSLHKKCKYFILWWTSQPKRQIPLVWTTTHWPLRNLFDRIEVDRPNVWWWASTTMPMVHCFDPDTIQVSRFAST